MANLTFCTTTVLDHGAISQLAAALQANCIKRPLICTDKGIVAAGILEQGARRHSERHPADDL